GEADVPQRLEGAPPEQTAPRQVERLADIADVEDGLPRCVAHGVRPSERSVGRSYQAATIWPGSPPGTCRKGGVSRAQRSVARRLRGAKGSPAGRFSRLGACPRIW